MPVDLKKLFIDSLDDFVNNDATLIEDDVNERSLCSRLAMYIQSRSNAAGLKEYVCDTEYNRKQEGRVKTIVNLESVVINITPDIILHSRGRIRQRDNLIAIEMKKSHRPRYEFEADIGRLQCMTREPSDGIYSYDGTTMPEHVCGYELGVFLIVNRNNKTIVYYTIEEGKVTGENVVKIY